MDEIKDEEKINNEVDVVGGNKLSKEKLSKRERAKLESERDLENNKNNPKKKSDYVYNPKRGRFLQGLFFIILFGLLFLLGWIVKGCVS